MVFVASGLGYFVTSFFSGRLTHALGIGLLLAASTALVAAAMFGFAFSPLWALFVACAVVHGLGSGAIDAGLNGYAAHYLSARHMNWLHACYCFGAMLGPLLMTAVLTSGRRYSTGYLGRRRGDAGPRRSCSWPPGRGGGRRRRRRRPPGSGSGPGRRSGTRPSCCRWPCSSCTPGWRWRSASGPSPC